MKRFKQLFAVTLLILTLGIPASAGEIGMPGCTTPPPPPSASVAGEIEIPGTEPVPGDFSSPGMEEIALEMFFSALSLF